MGFPTVTFRPELDPVVKKELDSDFAEVTELLSEQHNDQGEHTSITADRVTITNENETLVLKVPTPDGEGIQYAELKSERETDGLGASTSNINLIIEAADVAIVQTERAGECVTFGDDGASIFTDSAGEFVNRSHLYVHLEKALRIKAGTELIPSSGQDDFLNTGLINVEHSYYSAAPSSARTVDGIHCDTAGGTGYLGQMLWIFNNSLHNLTWNHAGVADVRTIKTPLSLPAVAGPRSVSCFRHDDTCWRLLYIYSQDGHWDTQVYSAGNFTASGSQTWGVDDADETIRYMTVGKTLYFDIVITASDVGGTASTELRWTLPLGITIANTKFGWILYNDAAAGNANGFFRATATNTFISFEKTDGSVWTITAGDNTAIVCQGWVEIT